MSSNKSTLLAVCLSCLLFTSSAFAVSERTAFGIDEISPRPAPTGTFKDVFGADHTLDEFKGRVLLVNLWATWCGPCVAEMPDLQELHKALGGEDFLVLALSQDDSLGKVSNFQMKHKLFALPMFLDNNKLFESYGVEFGRNGKLSMPFSLIINREGMVVAVSVGFRYWASEEGLKIIQGYIDEGKTATTEETSTLPEAGNE